MPDEPKLPWVVSISQTLVRGAAPLVPLEQREDWLREWNAEIWHRWQFLFHTGEWNRREKFLLLRSALGAFADAAWLMASQDSVKARISGIARSPFTCLAALSAVLLTIACEFRACKPRAKCCSARCPARPASSHLSGCTIRWAAAIDGFRPMWFLLGNKAANC